MLVYSVEPKQSNCNIILCSNAIPVLGASSACALNDVTFC